MNQVLSQSEVDILLAAVSEGRKNVDLEGAEEPVALIDNGDKAVIPYNLTRQDKIIRGRLPRLNIIYEEFVRSFQSSLSSTLRKALSLNHEGTDFLRFGEFIDTLPVPTCMSVLKFNGSMGTALLVFERNLFMLWLIVFLEEWIAPMLRLREKNLLPLNYQL